LFSAARGASRSSLDTVKVQFSSGLFPRDLLNLLGRQFNGVPERSLLRTVLYTGSKVHDDDADRGWPAANESSRGFSLSDPCCSLFALFLPFYSSSSIFRGTLDIENACKLDTICISFGNISSGSRNFGRVNI